MPLSTEKCLRNELMPESLPVESHYVYLVRCANDSLYTGYTKDVEQRIAVHNVGKGGGIRGRIDLLSW
jgi:putative endonuclease